MAGLLADPKVPGMKALGMRLGRLGKPLTEFFAKVPEIKACAFSVVSPEAPEALRQGSPIGFSWSTYFTWEADTLPKLKTEDRFPAAAWRLESSDAALSIASYCLLEFPSSACTVCALVALRDGYYWVHDVGLLDLHAPALGAYPKHPVTPVFPEEPTAHAAIGAESAFFRTFPAVEQALARIWGRDLLH